uniref:Uncharacterized protein n=1 Tax=Aegilops tauschii subsp. strangulata TaxID=200361 RepID=A0A452YV03_AEGTS
MKRSDRIGAVHCHPHTVRSYPFPFPSGHRLCSPVIPSSTYKNEEYARRRPPRLTAGHARSPPPHEPPAVLRRQLQPQQVLSTSHPPFSLLLPSPRRRKTTGDGWYARGVGSRRSPSHLP